MTSLDDLFKQIIHTERRAQERRNFLNEVKLRVQQLKEKIQETEQECVCLHGKLASKVQQLNEEDLSWKILQNKEKTFVHQIEVLTLDKKDVEKQLVDISHKKKEETDRFCFDVEDFVDNYSLISNGQAVREQQARQKLKTLREKYDRLKKGMYPQDQNRQAVREQQARQKLKTLREKYDRLKKGMYPKDQNRQAVREQQARQKLKTLREKYDRLKKAHHNYSEKKKKIEDLKEQYQLLVKEKENLNRQSHELDCQTQAMQQLTEEKRKTLNSPITDPEFVKLQHQLESLKNENLEEECKILQKELMRLQHLCWQKQVKERQKQQDLKRQRAREQNTVPVLNTSNRKQLSNFTPENTKAQRDELSDQVLQDMLSEEFSQVTNQKSLFRKDCSK